MAADWNHKQDFHSDTERDQVYIRKQPDKPAAIFLGTTKFMEVSDNCGLLSEYFVCQKLK